MSPREALFRVLSGEPVSPVPVWLLFPYHPTGYYVDVRSHPAYRRVFDHSLEHGVVMLDRRKLGGPLHTKDVVRTEENVSTQNGTVRRRYYEYKGTRIHEDPPNGKKLLESEEDLEAFCAFPLQLDETELRDSLEAQVATYSRERGEFPLDRGAMMLDLGSPVNVLYHCSRVQEYAIWSITQRDTVEDWLERRMAQLEFTYRFCLERDLADVYFLVGSELAAPPLVSHETFQRWAVPYERKLVSLVHSYGKRVIVHFHGQIREVLADFAEIGPDALHTIEAPPVGNCTLDQAFEATNEAITLIGNVQYDEFRSLDPREMKGVVQAVLDEVGERPFILSPTAGPFDESPPQRLIDNYIAFIDAAMHGRS